MTLAEFLLARIAEDEAAARDVGEDADAPYPSVGDYGVLGTREHYCLAVDPARVLAECEAKRRIVEECRGQGDQGPSAATLADIVLCDLASVYADHPGYDKEWTP